MSGPANADKGGRVCPRPATAIPRVAVRSEGQPFELKDAYRGSRRIEALKRGAAGRPGAIRRGPDRVPWLRRREHSSRGCRSGERQVAGSRPHVSQQTAFIRGRG